MSTIPLILVCDDQAMVHELSLIHILCDVLRIQARLGLETLFAGGQYGEGTQLFFAHLPVCQICDPLHRAGYRYTGIHRKVLPAGRLSA